MKIQGETVRLETASGEFVHESTIPPFMELPKVVLWGTRVFIRHLAEFNMMDAPRIEALVYRECFFYFLADVESVKALAEG